MKRIEIVAPCICAGRNMNEGMLIDPETITPSDLAVLIGCGLAREVDRYEVQDAAEKVVCRDPRPAKKAKK